ncbi:MAG: hypothetical protein ACI9FB_002572 [Candidatus Azotimanducaceae bacterium]|jgi:hypothetical protein
MKGFCYIKFVFLFALSLPQFAAATITWNPAQSTHNGIAFVEVAPGVGTVEFQAPSPTNPAGAGLTVGTSYVFGFSTAASQGASQPSMADTNLAGSTLGAGTSLVLVFDKGTSDEISFIAMVADASNLGNIGIKQLSATQIEIRAKIVDPILSLSNNPDAVGAAFGMVIQLVGATGGFDMKGTVFVSDMHWQDIETPTFGDLPQSTDDVEGFAAGIAGQGLSVIGGAGTAKFTAYMQESFFEFARANGVNTSGGECLGYRTFVELTGSDDGFERLNSPIESAASLSNFDVDGDGNADAMWQFRITNSEWSRQTLSFGLVENTNQFTLTSAGSGGGSVSPSSVVVDESQTAQFTLTPNSGFAVESTSGCQGTLSNNTFTTEAITSACTLAVSFALDTDRDGTIDTTDTDDDGDGVLDVDDAFPLDSSETLDTDGDNTGNNADTDDDGDGVLDGADAFPLDSSESIDTDNDGSGNNVDADDDGDSVSDVDDVFPLDSSETTDTDNDGTGNNADTDDDNDGVVDTEDVFPLDPSETLDTDNDALGNNTDDDDDNDGVLDVDDEFPLDASNTPIVKNRLVNLATRGFVGIGDNVLIGGLVITGSEPKSIVIRARGPALTEAGVEGALSDPNIILFSGSTIIDSNDDWPDHSNQSQVPSHLRPENSRESVIATTLNPGPYTAIVTGVNNEQGIGLVEIFEVNDTGSTKLQNIATRGLVSTGDGVLIVGLVISGSEPKKLVVRAKGPSLSEQGVEGVLADPEMTLFSGATVIDSNDNWQDHARSDEVPESLRPGNVMEATIYTELTPGAYTAIVSGVGGSTGVGIVEVFEVE